MTASSGLPVDFANLARMSLMAAELCYRYEVLSGESTSSVSVVKASCACKVASSASM